MVTIARAIRRSFRLCPDFREDSNTGLEIAPRNIFDQFGAEVMGSVENLVEHCFRTALEMDGLATAIRIRIAAFHPAVIFQTIEQTGEGGAFDSHPLGDDLLGQLV